MDMRTRENYLIHVLAKGFERASLSFSRLINRPVKIVNPQFILVRHDDNFSYISDEHGDLNVLVTQVIGDVSGKSFLIFSHDESEEIFSVLKSAVSNPKLNEAFLLEIDNIISASVISELSNSLDLEIYGDVPHIQRIHSDNLQDFLHKDGSSGDPSSMIFCNIRFQFDIRERVNPQYIWRLSSKIFELIPEKKLQSLQV